VKGLSPLYHYLSQPEIANQKLGRFVDMAYHTDVPSTLYILPAKARLGSDATRDQVFETCIHYLFLMLHFMKRF
jgi:hypothetical protein